MKYLWKYSEWVNRINSAGAVGVKITPATHQILQPAFISVRGVGAEDVGGTSGTTVNYKTDFHGTLGHLLDNDLSNYVVLPNRDYLGSFNTMDLNEVYLIDGDEINIYRDYMQINSSVIIEVRTLINIYARPKITYFDATNNSRQAIKFNDIKGELE